jgi:pimeloyl-ACP methyl ester carboxylesterase
MKLTEHRLNIDGKKYNYWTAGDSKKQPVVFLHGFLGNHKGLMWLAEFFTDDYFVIMPDFPACGKSKPLVKKQHGVESYAEWLDALLQEISVKQAVIIGHSFGSRVAAYYAAHYQKKMAAVVLLTPVIRVEKFWAYLAVWGHQLAKVMPASMRKKYLANKPYQQFVFWLTFKSDDKITRSEVMQESLAEARKVDMKVHMEMLEDLHRHDIQTWAKDILVPCMAIAGRKDDIVSVASVEHFTADVKQSRLEIMENTGHLLPIEYPQVTAEIIQSWLRNL